MELMVRIGAKEVVRDVRLETEHEATVADIISVLQREFEIAAQADVFCERLGGLLNPDWRVDKVGLLHGDTIELVQPGSRQRANSLGETQTIRAIVEVVDGPLAGASWSLEPGTYDLGKAPSNKVYLNDSTLTIRHATVKVNSDGTASVTANDTGYLDGRELGRTETLIPPGARLTLGQTVLTFRTKAAVVTGGADKAGQVLFNRSPHFEHLLERRTIARIEQPPSVPTSQGTNWFTILGPLVMGLVLYLMTRQIVTLVFVAMMPVMSIGGTLFSKKEARKRYEDQCRRWSEELERINLLAVEELDRERIARYDITPSGDQTRQWIEVRSSDLWRRTPTDKSFMSLRVGLGEVEASGQIEFEKRFSVEETNQSLIESATDIVERYKAFPSAPIALDWVSKPILGLWGGSVFTGPVSTAWLVQTLALHSPQELILCAAVGKEGADFSFLKWAPHTNSTSSPIEGAHFADNPLQARALCEIVAGLCEARGENKFGENRNTPHILMVITEEAGIDLPTVSRLLDRVSGRGVSILYVAKQLTTLPHQCDSVLGGAGVSPGFYRYETSEETTEISPDHLDSTLGYQLLLKLSPFRDAAASSAAASIPRSVPLSGIVGTAMFEPSEVLVRWSNAVPGTLRAPIGMDADGPWLLDIVENGPHALIAGTSGAGKSELLQSMVLSLAASYPPDMLNFLYVDYKGGAAFGPCLELPHSVGMVTDLDETMALRALVSLRAELKRREHILAGRARDIIELAKVAPEICPPRLMIVVDEFATLVKEIPDFVSGMVDVAQRGRSLGIHLVLATQRPAGSVSDNIVANTPLRIALRVLDSADSSSVIGTSEAASIPAPLRGRAYVRTGPRELACVQTAWANAPLGSGKAAERAFVHPFFTTGRQNSKGPEGPAELSVAVETLKKAAEGMPEPRKPWLEPLPDFVSLDALNTSDFNTRQGGELVIGLADDPELQEQYPATVSWEDDGGILVLGSGGSGRTTALRTIAASLASSCSPAQAALYALDFNNRALEALHVLGNTVEVAHADEPERVTAVIIAVEEHITRNKNLLARHQVSSFSELIDSGVEAQRCVLLLDDYASFHSAYEKLEGSDWVTRLHTIVTQGRQAGVHVALTADRRASVPSALFSTIGKRIVLRISDADEMVALGVKHHSDAPDGRAWLSRGLACQLAVVGQDRSARGQAEALERIGAAQRDRNEKLFILPETVGSLNLRTDGDVAIGVEDLTGAEALVDLDMGHVFVTGPPRSGKTNLLLSIASQAALSPDSYVFALSVSGTLDDPRWLYGDKNNAGEVLEACKAASTGLDLKCSALLVIDDAEDFAEGTLATLIQDVMSQPGVRVVCATESHYLSRAYSGWLADVKRPRRAVLLQPDLEMEGQLVSMRLKVRPGVTFGVGRGLYVRESGISVVQTSSCGV